MKQILLSDLIESKLILGRESALGYKAIKCEVCSDYKERGGFKFDNYSVHYNCFNCKATFSFIEGSSEFSSSAKYILQKFDFTQTDLDKVTSSSFFNKSKAESDITLETLKKTYSLITPEIKFPDHTFKIGHPEFLEIQKPICDYLESRMIDPIKINAHFSITERYKNRAIIPCYRNDKLIFWQARTIVNNAKRYDAPAVKKEAILWGYSNIWSTQKLLFITEGIFDAYHLNGVAILGSVLNDAKKEILNKCRKRKIVVIDKDKNGHTLGKLALENNWEITFLDSKDDVNNSCIKYGELFTIQNLLKNIQTPSSDIIKNMEARLNLDLAMVLDNLIKGKK